MLPEINRKFLKKHAFKIGVFYFYENLIISEMDEGVSVDFDKVNTFSELAQEVYGKTTPFVYISNRKNSYSINPVGHFKCLSLFPNLKGYGVVVYDDINLKTARLERGFINDKAANIFKNLEDAFQWAEKLLVKD